MFDKMLAPDTEKGQVTPSVRDMIAEGCLMIAAGTDTTANALGNATFYITQNPIVQNRLLEEWNRRIPDAETMLDSATLEGPGFEYLRAVVKETLRLSFGVPGRMIRKVPKEGAAFSGVFVHGGVSLRTLMKLCLRC